ncbi:hypothetical protein AAMO2058_000759100 [Amorphochlora amoebiformis]
MGLIFSSGESRELKISMALNQGKTLGEAKGYANPSFDPRLNFVRPDNKRASDFFIAAQQAANAARELALKTKPDINCCSMNKSKLPPWKWVEATKALQAPNQEGAFWRYLAIIAVIDLDSMLNGYVDELKEGGYYFTLERRDSSGGVYCVAQICKAFLDKVARAKTLVPKCMVSMCTSHPSTWDNNQVRIFLWFMGFGTSQAAFWGSMAFAIPPSVDGKLLCDASFNIDSAAMQIINLHTAPGRGEPPGYRSTRVQIIKDWEARLGFSSLDFGQRGVRTLARVVVCLQRSTLPFVSKHAANLAKNPE